MIELKKEVIKYAQKLNSTNLSPLRSGNVSVRATQDGVDEWSDDQLDGCTPPTQQFRMPKTLRGWLCLTRSGIPIKEHSGILHMTKG